MSVELGLSKFVDVMPDPVYKSPSQRARVLTESWLAKNGFCPACGSSLKKTANNSRVLDFTCPTCHSNFELKSKNGKFGNLIADGAYESMMAAIRSSSPPNLFLLNYQLPFAVSRLSILPRRFLVEPIVIKRKPLSAIAKRAGWVGCNLNLTLVPRSALIDYVIDGVGVPREQVLKSWEKTAALDQLPNKTRGWLAVTLGIVDRLNKPIFTISDIYGHEVQLLKMFPDNRNIRAKLRQQLQLLRDIGLIEFFGNGKYAIKV